MDWSEVRTALEELMALPAPEREARLASIAQRDPGLSAELATLLDHDRAATESTRGFLEPTPVPGTARSVGGGLHAGDEVEGFRIVARLGAGGMGTVWEATQKSPARRVALKTLGTDAQGWSHAERWRFEHEAAVLASLRHPAIAQVYAVGCARAGDEEVPWFALELVEDARDLTTWAAEEHASRAERLRLFTQLCEAVQHGHQRGVIHRDLKPSNILVDREGHVKLIDFGVARALEGSTQTAAMRTRAGELVGTLQYMAPEQFDAGGPELDVRCDIYALGVVLYQLLCGRLPFDFTGASLTEIARIVREEDPRRPSRSDGGLEGDLEWILLKALAKEPGRRYASVGALIEDLRRSASDEPVLAGPPSKAYRFSKFVRRNRVLVATSSALLVGLLLATGGVVLGLFEARAAEKRARTEEGLAKTARNEAEHQKGIADTQATLAREERDRASREAQKRGLVLELVEGMFPDVEDTVAGREVRVVDMLDAAVLDFDGQVARDPEVEYSFRRMLGTTFHRLRLFDRSAAQLERALELEGELPEESIGDDALLGHVFLGAAWTRTGREEEGEALLRETLAEADRVGFGEAQLGARNYLLVFLSNRGAFEEALELSSEMQALAAEQGDVVRELNALNLHANALRQLSRFEEAMPVCEEAFLRFEELEGPYSHHTIATGLNHAGNLFQTGRLEEAAELYPELLDRAAEVMGADSDLTLGNRESYALLLHTMGERERAAEILLEVVDAYEQRNRPTLYHVLALRSLGLMYRRRGADDQAEPHLRRGVELGEGFLAEDNFYLATIRQAHGCCLVALGRPEEGEEILAVAWGTIEATLPPKHPRRAEWIAEIASAYEKQGRAQDAARWREHLGP